MGHDYDLTLTAGLEAKDVDKTVKDIAKSAQKALAQSVSGVKDLDNALNSAQNGIKKTSESLDKAVKDTQKDVEKLKNTKIDSGISKEAQETIDRYQKQLNATKEQMKQLKATQDAMGKTKAVPNQEWEKQKAQVEALQKQYEKIEARRQHFYDVQKGMGKDDEVIKNMAGYKKFEAELTLLAKSFVDADDALKGLKKTVDIPMSATKEYKDIEAELRNLQKEYDKTKAALDLFKADIADQSLEKSVVQPTQKIKSAMNALDKMEVKIGTKEFDKQAERVRQKIAEIEIENKKLAGMEVPTEKYQELEKQVANAQKQFDTLKAKAEEYRAVQTSLGFKQSEIEGSEAFRKITKAQDEAYASLIHYKQKMGELVASGGAMMPGKDSALYKQNEQAIGSMRARYNQLISDNEIAKAAQASEQAVNGEGEAAKDASGKMEELSDKKKKATDSNGKLADSASKTGKVMSTVGNGIKKTFGLFGKTLVSGITKPFNRLRKNSTNTFGDMAKSAKLGFMKILKYAFGIRSIYALFRRLRKYIKEAFGAMSESVPQVKQEIDTLKVNFTQLRNSLATAFQPIFSYVVPALNALCNALVSAMNVLANFFATLTGQKFIYKATKANDALADSIGGAGKAAKDANEDIAEYDKLIVINKNNDPNSGGGGGGNANANAD